MTPCPNFSFYLLKNGFEVFQVTLNVFTQKYTGGWPVIHFFVILPLYVYKKAKINLFLNDLNFDLDNSTYNKS